MGAQFLKHAMTITVRRPDIETEISFIPTENGGRQTAVKSGYRANHNFGFEGMLNDAAHEYIGQESVSPGESVLANIWFLVPEYQTGRLTIGFKFTVQEGAHVVGYGRITKILNDALQNASNNQ